MHLSKTTTIAEIQEEFNKEYPYLKLEFFNNSHKKYAGSHISDIIRSNTTLGAISTIDKDIEVWVDCNMPVYRLERLLESNYGLNVQIYRKSGNTWLQTSTTDYLSLELQNLKGLQSEKYHIEKSKKTA